jgi:hypothetical protein
VYICSVVSSGSAHHRPHTPPPPPPKTSASRSRSTSLFGRHRPPLAFPSHNLSCYSLHELFQIINFYTFCSCCRLLLCTVNYDEPRRRVHTSEHPFPVLRSNRPLNRLWLSEMPSPTPDVMISLAHHRTGRSRAAAASLGGTGSRGRAAAASVRQALRSSTHLFVKYEHQSVVRVVLYIIIKTKGIYSTCTDCTDDHTNSPCLLAGTRGPKLARTDQKTSCLRRII